MSAGVLLAVLLGAFLHASWNLLVKAGRDTHFAAAGVYIGAGVLSGIALPLLRALARALTGSHAPGASQRLRHRHLYDYRRPRRARLPCAGRLQPVAVAARRAAVAGVGRDAPRLSLGRRAPTVARRRTGRGVLGRLVHAGAVGDDARTGGRGCRGSRDLDRVRRGA